MAADLFLGSVVDSITGQVAYLISGEIGGALGANDDIKKLGKTVEAIRAVLAEAEKRQVQEEPIKLWLKRLCVAVYEADDLLDDFSTEVIRRRLMGGHRNIRINKEVRIFFSSSNRLLYSFKMAHRVKSIRETLDAINKDRVEYKLDQDNTGNPAQYERRNDLLKKKAIRFDDNPSFYQSNLIGRDDDKIKICDLLFNDSISDENVSVVPIVGIGGLGKTTLARLIYNDERVGKHFGLKFWVCVSENFDAEIIVKKILQSCDAGRKLEDCGVDELPKKIEGKKYLLVLDDLWNENRDLWLNLVNFLGNGAKGSKILVTTRSEGVAKTMTRDIVYRLEGLSLDESLSLLMLMANKKEYEWKNQRIEEIGSEIARKCGGVPLAIMTIGRLLCSKDTEKDWEVFNSREFVNIKQETGDILPTLKLSYDILPSQLKQCFTYCSLFPKDYEFNPNELINLWMAQGFLKSQDNRSMEEVGHDYFMELVWGSFFQDIEKDMYGNVIMCKMHDLMHDLAQKEAGSNFALVGNSNTGKYCPGEVLHVCLYNGGGFECVREAHSRARSLLCFEDVNEDLIKDISRNFSNTRVLGLRGSVYNDVVPKEIGNLNHLRSLHFKFSGFKALPFSISKLYNLETLNLEYCMYLIELSRGITELVSLRHLNIKRCSALTHMPKGIEKLTNLQTLTEFIVGEKGKDDAGGLDELSKLPTLGNHLTLSHLERLGEIFERNGTVPIQSLNLLSLELRWVGYDEEEVEQEVILDRLQPHSDLKGLSINGYKGYTFSYWVSQLHELVVLEITSCVYCRQLPPIHQLPFLKSLKLHNLIELEYIEEGDMNSAFFPSLQKMDMIYLPNFKGWRRKYIRGNNSQEKEIYDEDDDLLLPIFLKTQEVCIEECPKFSYMGGEGHLLLINVNEKYLLKWVRNNSTLEEVPVRFLSLSSVPIAELKSLEICGSNIIPSRLLLQCLPFLESLKISNCSEIDLTSVLEGEADQMLLHGLTSSRIEKIVIEGVEGMTTLPWWFQHLSGLKVLTIQECDGLESLSEVIMCCLTSLTELSLVKCRSIKSLSRGTILHLIQTLQNWSIKECRELDLNGELDGSSNNMDISELSVSTALRELIIDGSKAEFLPWWIGHLSNLEKLFIYHWKKLNALPDFLCNLTSLEEFDLYKCKALESLSRKTIIHLISTLRKWTIHDCGKLDLEGVLDEKDDAASNSQLTRMPILRELTILKSEAEFFPWWVEHLNNLEELLIEEWDNLKALPEWLHKLTSLGSLSICECPLLMGEGCKEDGEDAAKISHIDNVYVNSIPCRSDGKWTPVAL